MLTAQRGRPARRKRASREGVAIAGHRRQHFVPRAYLKAWCDPNTPAGQEPYVWRFNKDGSDPRRKAPDNLFHGTDLYTIHIPGGERDLVLEHLLSGLESAYVAIRDTKLAHLERLTSADRLVLCAFIAAAEARTPARRDHFAGEWGGVLDDVTAGLLEMNDLR